MSYWNKLRLISLVGLVAMLLLVLLVAAEPDPGTAPPQPTPNNSFNF